MSKGWIFFVALLILIAVGHFGMHMAWTAGWMIVGEVLAVGTLGYNIFTKAPSGL